MTINTFLLLWIAVCLTVAVGLLVQFIRAKRHASSPLPSLSTYQDDSGAKWRYTDIELPNFVPGGDPTTHRIHRKLVTDPEEAKRDAEDEERLVATGLRGRPGSHPLEPDIEPDAAMPLE